VQLQLAVPPLPEHLLRIEEVVLPLGHHSDEDIDVGIGIVFLCRRDYPRQLSPRHHLYPALHPVF